MRMIQWYFTPVKAEESEDGLITYNIVISLIESVFIFPFFCYLFRETLNTYAQEKLQCVILVGFVFTFIGLIISKIIYNGMISNNNSACLTLGSMLRELWQALADKCIARGKTYEIEGK